MKLTILTPFLTSILFFGCSNGQAKNRFTTTTQNKSMEKFEYAFNSAHPKAQALMTDEFYWSPIEETAPFGSDDGSDAAYGFREWRLLNKNASPVSYLKELIERWQYPYFDYNEMDTAKIKAYITSQANPDEHAVEQQMQMMREALQNSPDTMMKDLDDKQLREIMNATSKELGGSFLIGQDNAIIGIGFAQFVLEGHIDNDIKALTITAINRQLLPLLINRYDDSYQKIRKEQLSKMLEVMKNAG
jgi:uncharacterized protein YfeS